MTSNFIGSSGEKVPIFGVAKGWGNSRANSSSAVGEILATGQRIACAPGLSIPRTPEKTLRLRVKNRMYLTDTRAFIDVTFFLDFGGR
jgi:hypothetical protein